MCSDALHVKLVTGSSRGISFALQNFGISYVRVIRTCVVQMLRDVASVNSMLKSKRQYTYMQ